MDDYIIISWLNDFIFCPVSIYFHQLYGNKEKMLCQSTVQIAGTNAHGAVDEGKYSTRKTIMQGTRVISEKYRLVGKIDTFDIATGILTERKKKIAVIYDGYIFQLYAQYFCLKEMGYKVNKIRFYSVDTNKIYNIALPEEDIVMCDKFEATIKEIRKFSLFSFIQTNKTKCANCIYEPACDRSLL